MLLKVCGMREPNNIEALLQEVQPDFMGHIFYPRSSRFVDQPLTNHGTSTLKIGVFVNAGIEDILDKVKAYHLAGVQLHGQEPPAVCQTLKEKQLVVIKAFRVDPNFDFSSTEAYKGLCDYYLFDTMGSSPGGTGKKFDWSLLDKYVGETPFLLSGGLRPGDGIDILQMKHPKFAGVDINSGFEIAPGLKNISEIQTFLHAIQR